MMTGTLDEVPRNFHQGEQSSGGYATVLIWIIKYILEFSHSKIYTCRYTWYGKMGVKNTNKTNYCQNGPMS